MPGQTGPRIPIASTSARTARRCRRPGIASPTAIGSAAGRALRQETGTVLGGFAKVESVAAGFQRGLRFLSLMMLALGLPVALVLWHAARALRAPPGAGYA